jgi:hypothetical protein
VASRHVRQDGDVVLLTARACAARARRCASSPPARALDATLAVRPPGGVDRTRRAAWGGALRWAATIGAPTPGTYRVALRTGREVAACA